MYDRCQQRRLRGIAWLAMLCSVREMPILYNLQGVERICTNPRDTIRVYPLSDRTVHFLLHPRISDHFEMLMQGRRIPLPDGGVLPSPRTLIEVIKSFHQSFAAEYFMRARAKFHDRGPSFYAYDRRTVDA